MDFDIDRAVPVLARTPLVLRAMIQGLPAEWVNANEGDRTWSPFDVLGHLIHGERTDWIPRARMILESGDSRTFETFDRFAQERESKGKGIDELLDQFEALRAENLRVLENMKLTAQDLQRPGMHPQLGRVTLGQLLATWVAHDLDHLVQISRTMAKQYKDAVGPWREFLTVVR
jgi:DinB family protein